VLNGSRVNVRYFLRIQKSVRKKYLVNNDIYKVDGNTSYRIAFNDPSGVIADFRYQRELQSFDDSTLAGSPPPVTLVPAFNSGSDVLLVKGAIGPTYVVNMDGLYDTSHASIQISTTRYPFIDLQANQYAVLSQCASAEVFKITGTNGEVSGGKIAHGAGVLADENSAAIFDTEALTISKNSTGELRRVATVAYYISNNASGVPTLFRSIDGIANPLVEGVEQMQILYGLDTSGDNAANTYMNSAAIALSATNDMSQAVTARLNFIMRSQQEVRENNIAQTYSMPGEADYNVTDKYARQVFTTTVTLRNRLTGR